MAEALPNMRIYLIRDWFTEMLQSHLIPQTAVSSLPSSLAGFGGEIELVLTIIACLIHVSQRSFQNKYCIQRAIFSVLISLSFIFEKYLKLTIYLEKSM